MKISEEPVTTESGGKDISIIKTTTPRGYSQEANEKWLVRDFSDAYFLSLGFNVGQEYVSRRPEHGSIYVKCGECGCLEI